MIPFFSTLGVLIALFILANLKDWLTPNSRKFGSATILKRSPLLKRSNKGTVIDGRRRLSLSNSYLHLILAAMTGAGKTLKMSLVNILLLSESIVISDPKGELHTLSSGYLAKKGFKVLTIDLSDPNSLGFNPIIRLKDDSAIKAFAELLYDLNSQGSKTAAIWRQGSIDIIVMCLQCLINLKDERYVNFANLIHLVNNLDVSNGCQKAEPFFAMFGRMNNNAALNAFKRFREQEIKIRFGQYSNCITMLSQFNTKEMLSLMSKDEIDFSLLRKQKTALFLKIPTGKQAAFAPFLSLFFTQMFDYFLSTEIEEKDHGVFLLLDEFGILNKLPSLMELISLGRSQKVSINVICQSFQQIRAKYKDDFDSIMDNFNSHLVLPGLTNIDTLSYYEKLLGVQSYEDTDPNTGKVTINSRYIKTLDEIRCLPDNAALFIHKNKPAVLLKMKALYEQPLLMAKAGIKSVNGKLVPTIPPVPSQSSRSKEISYIDFDWLRSYCEKQAVKTSTEEEETLDLAPIPKEENSLPPTA